MPDTVRVAPDTFTSLHFMESAERKEFTRDNRPANERPQKRNRDDVPVWSVKLAAVNWRGNSQLISVTVAMPENPAGKFKAGDPVQLSGLVFGVTPKRDGGYVCWCAAEAISPASGPNGASAAAAKQSAVT